MLHKQYQQGNAFLPYLTLVLIAGLVTINLWLYFWSPKEMTPSQPQTVDTTTDPLAGWQTYTNNELGYEIKYPPEWSAKKMNMLGGYIHLAGPEVTTEQGLLPKGSDLHYLEIFPWDGKTIPVSTVKDQDGKFLQFENIKTVTVGPITGQQGDLVGIPYKTISLLRDNTNGVRIEWETTNDDHYHKLYQQILSTFRFTQPEVTIPADWKTYNNNELGLSFMYPPSIGSLNATTTAHHGETIFWPPGGENVTLYGKAVRVYKASSDIYKSDFTLYSKTKDYLQLADGACDSPSCVDAMTIEKISQDCGKRFPSDGYYRECLILNNHQIEIVIYPNEASEYYAVAYMVWDHNDYPTVTTVSKIWTADSQLSPNQAQAKLKELLASEQPSSARTAYNEFRTILSTLRFTK